MTERSRCRQADARHRGVHRDSGGEVRGPPDLIRSIITHESGGDPNAYNAECTGDLADEQTARVLRVVSPSRRITRTCRARQFEPRPELRILR